MYNVCLLLLFFSTGLHSSGCEFCWTGWILRPPASTTANFVSAKQCPTEVVAPTADEFRYFATCGDLCQAYLVLGLSRWPMCGGCDAPRAQTDGQSRCSHVMYRTCSSNAPPSLPPTALSVLNVRAVGTDCATSYGDLVASALDLHVHSTGLSLVCLAAMAAAGLASLAAVVYFRGRHVRILGALDKPEGGTPGVDRPEQTRNGRRPREGLQLPLGTDVEKSRRSMAPRASPFTLADDQLPMYSPPHPGPPRTTAPPPPTRQRRGEEDEARTPPPLLREHRACRSHDQGFAVSRCHENQIIVGLFAVRNNSTE